MENFTGKRMERPEAIKSMINGHQITDGEQTVVVWFDEGSGLFKSKNHPNVESEWGDYYDVSTMNMEDWYIFVEPTYEWQWLIPVKDKIATFTITPSHFTDEEAERDDNIERGLIRVEVSKRPRERS